MGGQYLRINLTPAPSHRSRGDALLLLILPGSRTLRSISDTESHACVYIDVPDAREIEFNLYSFLPDRYNEL